MASGKVLRFNESHGFGFVAPHSGGEDVFFHVNDIDFPEQLLRTGLLVDFEFGRGDRGLKASKVRLSPVVERSTLAAPRDMSPRDVTPRDVTPNVIASRSTDGSMLSPDRDGSDMQGDEDLCDVLTPTEFLRETTETLLRHCGTLTADQILAIRVAMLDQARVHGWVDTSSTR